MGASTSSAATGWPTSRSGTPVTEDTVFRIASISKTITAIAVLQLCERGAIELDAPANDYLRAYRLVPAKAGFPPATVRHLLTHTAGVPEELRLSDAVKPDFGESFRLGQAPPLAEYYRGGLRLAAEPGTRFIYTDHGFATLGQIVEDVSGMPFDAYLREHVFAPLGMADTDLLRTAAVESRLATGYTLGSRGARCVTDRQWVTAGASSVYSTPRDMARYLAALLGGGANEHGSVLEPATLASMFAPQYQPDPRVAGMGLAFTRVVFGGHPAVEHGGILPGFNSQIFVAPDDGIGVMAFTNGARLAMLWLPGELASLLGRLLGAPDDVVRSDVLHHPEVWGELCGRYWLSARLTDARAQDDDGRRSRGLRPARPADAPRTEPRCRRCSGAFHCTPTTRDDPYVFRIDVSEYGIGTMRVVFGRDPRSAP